MNAVGYVLGQLIGLALIPAALIWALRGTRPGRVVWGALTAMVRTPGRRRDQAAARARHDRFQQWRASIVWWMRERDSFPPDHPQHEAARDLVRYFELHMPEPCYCRACFLPGVTPPPRSF